MAHDAFEQLLRRADAAAPAPPLLEELPVRVARRLARRRSHQAVAAVCGIAVLVIAGVAAVLREPSPVAPTQVATDRPRTTPPNVLPPRSELARLDIEAALHEQTARLLLEARPTRPAASEVTETTVSPALADVREQRDRAALVLIYEADRAFRDKRTDRAVAAYRRTIELFPSTYWAGVARRRLKEMTT